MQNNNFEKNLSNQQTEQPPEHESIIKYLKDNGFSNKEVINHLIKSLKQRIIY